MSQDEKFELMPTLEPIGGVLEQIERAEIDIQISTAHQYPRSLSLFKKRALEMVTLDEETAQSCIYRRPVGKKGGKVEYAEGKSIRMAEIVGACYGNLRVASMIVEQNERFVKCRGAAHDLESNFAASSEVIESTVTKDGNPYSERMRVVVAKACLAKARRDATFQVVPAALCKSLEDAARKTAIGTTATLDRRRKKVLDWINKAGIDIERVYLALGINGIEDIGLGELETLTGIKTAIKEGDSTIDEAFPLSPIKMPAPKVESKKVKEQKTEEKKPEHEPEPEPEHEPLPSEPGNNEPIKNNTGEISRTNLFDMPMINSLDVYCKRKGLSLEKLCKAKFGVGIRDLDPTKLSELETYVLAEGRRVI